MSSSLMPLRDPLVIRSSCLTSTTVMSQSFSDCRRNTERLELNRAHPIRQHQETAERTGSQVQGICLQYTDFTGQSGDQGVQSGVRGQGGDQVGVGGGIGVLISQYIDMVQLFKDR